MNLLRYYNDDGTLVEVSLATVESYLVDESKKNELADFIYKRFYYRYIKPFEYKSKNKIMNKSSGKQVDEFLLLYKNGFSMMANCCLLIETLETFQRGWENSNTKSEIAFLKFFTRDKNFKEFAVNDIPSIFYKSIRCGILHQGETTKGWKITRDENKAILDITSKEINAVEFLKRLKKSIEEYKKELVGADWNDQIWKMARIKLKSLVKESKIP